MVKEALCKGLVVRDNAEGAIMVEWGGVWCLCVETSTENNVEKGAQKTVLLNVEKPFNTDS